MIYIHAVFIDRIFYFSIMAFFLVGYLTPRKSKLCSFIGFVVVVWILQLFITKYHLYFETSIGHDNSLDRIIYIFLGFTPYFIGILINFKDTFLKSFFAFGSINFLGSWAEILAFSIVKNLDKDFNLLFIPYEPINFISISFLILTNIFSAIFMMIFFKIIRKKNINFRGNGKFIIIVLLFCMFFFGTIILSLEFSKSYLPPLYLIAIMFAPVIITIVFVCLLYANNRNYSLKLKADYNEHLNAMQSQHISEIPEQNLQITRLKHDFGTHSKLLSDLAEMGKYDELKKYISEFADEYTLEPLHFCSRGALNAVLSSKYRLAKQENIDIKIFFSSDGAENISDIDLCAVVSNLLQNAIEACKKTEETEIKSIKLSANAKADCFVISQTNSSVKPNDGFKTVKSDPENHGIGLSIIEEIVKKYNGSTWFGFEDGIFISTVIFCSK